MEPKPGTGKQITVTFLGDSITLGYALPDRSDRFPTVLAKRLGFTEDNQGITGTLVARAGLNNDNLNAYVDRAGLIHGADYAVVFGGTNDYFWSDKPIQPPDGKEDDLSYFSNALRYLCRTVTEKRAPGTTLLVTPYRHFGHGNFYGGKAFNDANDHPTSAVNYNGHTLGDYAAETVRVAGLYGIPVLDLYGAEGFDHTVMTIDGCHPNAEGHLWLADRIGEALLDLMKRN